jgi:hypothetical protein
MTAVPRVYICIRRTLDWHDETLVQANLRPSFRPKFEVWNATLDPPYHLFRVRLKQIAQANLAQVANALRAPLEEIPRGAVVIPVDDDDWLCPELADRLAARYDPRAAGYLWIRTVVEPPVPLRIRLWSRLRRRKASTCATNNYAISNRPELADLVYRHVMAGRYFDANGSRIKRVPGILSIQNRNVSSQTAMGWRRPSITRDELVRSVHRYRTFYASHVLPEELGWARPCMARMNELMEQIRVK